MATKLKIEFESRPVRLHHQGEATTREITFVTTNIREHSRRITDGAGLKLER